MAAAVLRVLRIIIIFVFLGTYPRNYYSRVLLFYHGVTERMSNTSLSCLIYSFTTKSTRRTRLWLSQHGVTCFGSGVQLYQSNRGRALDTSSPCDVRQNKWNLNLVTYTLINHERKVSYVFNGEKLSSWTPVYLFLIISAFISHNCERELNIAHVGCFEVDASPCRRPVVHVSIIQQTCSNYTQHEPH